MRIAPDFPGEIDDDCVRVNRTLAAAYRNASSQSDIDDEVACLKRAGVLLPNGFQPMPPFFSEFGEILSDVYNKDKE